MQTPTPYPTADIPTPPPSVQALQESLQRGQSFDLDWIGGTLHDIRAFAEGLAIRQAGPVTWNDIHAQGGASVSWTALYYLNAPFDLAMHFLLALVAGLLGYYSTLTILSALNCTLMRRRHGGRSLRMAAGFFTSLLSWLVAFWCALYSHLWWDSMLPPY